VILVASTVVTVLAAGPILSVMGASVTVSSAGLLTTLAVVVALPLAAGAALRAIWSPGKRLDALVRIVTVVALLVLLWQVASEIRLDAAYTRVIAALVAYIAGSALLGRVLSLRLPAGRAAAVMLPVAMRDFAVAAGIAAAAFGAAAAAPLGAYGVLVLLAGTVVAHFTGRRIRSLHHGAVFSVLRRRAYRQTAMARAITTTAAMMYVGPWKPLTMDCQLAPTAYPA
jgi:ACR3 family arsenite efflux pump ArsB